MDYWAEVKEWTQPDGLVTPRTKLPNADTTGNGLLYLSLVQVCAVLNRHPLRSVEYSHIVRSCYVPNHPGILKRSPTKENDQNGWDDYVGVATACYIMGMPQLIWQSLNAGNVRRFGLFKWFFKNNKPGLFRLFSKETWQAWFGRNPSVICHLQLCSGVWPHALRVLWWSFDVVFTAYWSMGKNHQSVILMYLQVMCWDRHWVKPWHVEKAVALFKKRLKLKYGDFKGVLVHEIDQNQPIIKHWPNSV